MDDDFRSGFFIFFKWQYSLRHDFLKCKDGVSFEEYLKTRDEDPAYLQPLETLFEQLLTEEFNLSHLLTLTPRSFRRGHHLVNFSFDEPILNIAVDLDKINVKANKKNIIEEIKGALDLCANCQDDDELIPASFHAIGYPSYWKNIADIRQFKMDLYSRITGLLLWDWSNNYDELSMQELIDLLYNKFPQNPEVDRDFESDTDYIESKYRKRLTLADKCIMAGDFLSK